MQGGKRFLLLYAIILGGLITWDLTSTATRLNYVKHASLASAVAGANTAKVKLAEPPTLPPYPTVDAPIPSFGAQNYVLYDVDSERFLVEKNADKAVPLASTTKIMTALLTIQNGQLTDNYTITKESAEKIGSTANLRNGEQMTVNNLLYCAMLVSGNDAAFSLADYVGSRAIGSDNSPVSYNVAVNRFIGLMNQKAKEWGYNSFVFTDPSGLDAQTVGSAADMARLASRALNDKTFRHYVSTAETTVTSVDGALSHPLKNSNRLVGEWQYAGAIGVKTGFTPEAGHNLVGAATRDGHTLIAVVFNTYSTAAPASAEVARDLLDFGWQHVTWR